MLSLLVSFVENMAVKFQHKETIMKHMGYITFQNSPDLAFLSQTKWKLCDYISPDASKYQSSTTFIFWVSPL